MSKQKQVQQVKKTLEFQIYPDTRDFFLCDYCDNPGLKVKIISKETTIGVCLNCLKEISDFYVKFMEENK